MHEGILIFHIHDWGINVLLVGKYIYIFGILQ